MWSSECVYTSGMSTVLSIKQNRLPAKFQFPARLANDNLIRPWESCGASRGQERRRGCQRREAQRKQAVKGSCVWFVSKTRVNIFRWSDQMCVNVSSFVRPRNTADTYLRRFCVSGSEPLPQPPEHRGHTKLFVIQFFQIVSPSFAYAC